MIKKNNKTFSFYIFSFFSWLFPGILRIPQTLYFGCLICILTISLQEKHRNLRDPARRLVLQI